MLASIVRVSLGTIGIISAILFGSLVLLFRTGLRERGARYYSPTETLGVDIGMTTTKVLHHGTVQIAGELWSAESDSGYEIAEGEKVMVSEVEGLSLKGFKVRE